jgi:putative membrane protein
MRALGFSTAVALALLTAACGDGKPDTNANLTTDLNAVDDAAMNDVLGVNEATDNEAAVVNPTDANGFATALAASDLFEIQSGKLAENRAVSAEVKAFGRQLVADHSQSSSQLKAAAAQATPAVTVMPAMDAEKQGMLDQLEAAKGADFDRLFIDQQTRAHQQALNLLQNYAGGGDQQPLRDFATKAGKVVEMHLDRLNGMKK